MLLTGGMVNIMAFKNDDTLTLDPQKGMELSFASPENEDFQLFAGNRNDDGNMNWAIAESRRISIGPDSTYAFADGRVPGIARNREISISSKKWNRWIRKGILVKQPVVRPTTTNTFRALKMGWINCDRFLNDPRAKSTKLIVNSDLDKKYMTTVHMVFPRINSVLTLSPRKGGQSYCLPGGGCRMKMPQDAKVYLVGMAYGNDETLFALKTIWTGKNSEENLEFEPKTSEEIKEILSGLKMDFGSLAGR